jgi:hypothetical protein
MKLRPVDYADQLADLTAQVARRGLPLKSTCTSRPWSRVARWC